MANASTSIRQLVKELQIRRTVLALSSRDVPRRDRLSKLECIVLQLCEFRQQRCHTVSAADLYELLDVTLPHAYRVLARLRKRGWLDSSGRFGARKLPLLGTKENGAPPQLRGFLSLDHAMIREHRWNDALQYRQQESMPSTSSGTGDGRAFANAGHKASLTASHRDTVRRAYVRLETGRTVGFNVRAKRAARRGEPMPVPVPLIERELDRSVRQPRVIVRCLSAREREERARAKRQAAAAERKRTPAAFGLEVPRSVAEALDQGAQMALRAVRRRPPDPPPPGAP